MVRAGTLVRLVALAALLPACNDEFGGLVTVEEPPDAGCLRQEEPHTIQVYFVIDVSGSMGPFLMDLSKELVAFADAFPELGADGRPVHVDYYVVAFVNDVRWFGGRMTSPIAVQAAIEQAVERGQTNMNLTQNRFNAEQEENTLDALAAVVASAPTAEAKLVMLANDAPFVEAPRVLSDGIRVQSSYASVLAELQALGVRVHAFVPEQLDGLSRSYAGMPSLTSLPGSTVHFLADLTGASGQIQGTLGEIARGSACN